MPVPICGSVMQLPEISLPIALAGSTGRVLRVVQSDGQPRQTIAVKNTTTNTSFKGKLGDTATLYEIDELGNEKPRYTLLISTSKPRYNIEDGGLCLEIDIEKAPTPPSGPPPASEPVPPAPVTPPSPMPESYSERLRQGWTAVNGNWLPPTLPAGPGQ